MGLKGLGADPLPRLMCFDRNIRIGVLCLHSQSESKIPRIDDGHPQHVQTLTLNGV